MGKCLCNWIIGIQQGSYVPWRGGELRVCHFHTVNILISGYYFEGKHRGEEGQSVGGGAAQQQQDVRGRLEAAVQELQDSAEETRILGTVSVTETAADSSSTRGADPR